MFNLALPLSVKRGQNLIKFMNTTVYPLKLLLCQHCQRRSKGYLSNNLDVKELMVMVDNNKSTQHHWGFLRNLKVLQISYSID